ncbi:TIGR03364 family FAD-dependent oxidoreductase [Microbulbifer sp. GL-2]|uniref:TIGR03364 family FAD-dependent oxidoreductase n=1 Tax=Microbulbifer sp. GL-2 TaxID=2591606 RepID=UPI001162D380|nr:TIGR03364 family FAD-dependent oxidoreductase [Microbulbifer sp. GL-2]BBM02187.1 oxidase [Microbulbifer sp. GL-2]
MKFDIAIVGAGVLGSFAAYHALKSGKKVLLIDASTKSHGATVRNFGQIVPSGMNLTLWRNLGRRSLELYRELSSLMPDALWQQGSLYVASSEEEAGLLEEMHEINRETDYSSKLITPTQCRERVPSLSQGYCHGGLLYPQEMSAESVLLMKYLWELLDDQPNLYFKKASPVTSIEELPNGVEVRCSTGNKFMSKHTLICCGHNLNQLFPHLLQTKQMQISKLQMFRTRPIEGIKIPGNLLTGLTIRRYEAFKSCPNYKNLSAPNVDPNYEKFGVHLLFRQSVDGSIIIGDSHEYFAARDTDTLSYEIHQEINSLMIDEANRILNLPHLNIDRIWNGYYSQENSRGVFLKSATENIHLATGIGGKGMTAGPALMERVIKGIFNEIPLEECLLDEY